MAYEIECKMECMVSTAMHSWKKRRSKLKKGATQFQASLSLSLHHFVRLMSRSYSNSSFYDQPRRRISVSTASGSGSSTYSSEKHSSSGESSDFYERPVYDKKKDRKVRWSAYCERKRS
jgi:hypothetical protein